MNETSQAPQRSSAWSGMRSYTRLLIACTFVWCGMLFSPLAADANADTMPNAYSFTDITTAALNTLTPSIIVKISGIDTATPTSISGGSAQYRICPDATCSTNPAWGSGASTINNDQYLQLRLTSSTSNATAITTTMNVGGVTDIWSVTTISAAVSCTFGTYTPHDSNRPWLSVAATPDGTKMAAVTNGDELYTSTDSGNTWTVRDTSREWLDVAVSNDGIRMAAVVNDGLPGENKIYLSSNSGVTWTIVPSVPDWPWHDIAMSADGRIIAATVNGTYLYLSTDYGATWATSGGMHLYEDVAMSADGLVIAALDNNGQIYLSTDMGTTWAAKDSNRAWAGLAMTPDSKKMIASVYGGVLYKSNDGGNTWGALTVPTLNWQNVAISDDGTRMIAGVDGGQIYYSLDSGTTWAASASTLFWYGIDLTSDGLHLFGTAYNDKIYTSDCTDTIPNAYNFTDVTSASVSTATASNIIQISGLGAPSPVSITGAGQYRVCVDATCSTSPAWTSTAGTISNNQYLQLQITSSASFNTAVSTNITVGGVTDNWSVTAMLDACPAGWTAANTCGGAGTSAVLASQAACNTWCSTQFNTTGPGCCDWRASTTTCRYRNGTLSGNVNFQGKICNGSASSCNIASGATWNALGNTCTVPSPVNVPNAGSQLVTDSIAPTTGSITYSCAAGVPSTSSPVCNDVTPNTFDFTDQTDVNISTAITSNTVTISGFTGPLNMVAAANTKISINGGAFSSAGATVAVNPGDTVALQLTSSASSFTPVTGSITLGTLSVNWVVITTTATLTCPQTVAVRPLCTTANNGPFAALGNTGNTATQAVWSDGRTVFIGDGTNIVAYSFNGTSFTQLATVNVGGVTSINELWGDGTYIYAAVGNSGLYIYSFNGLSLTQVGNWSTADAVWSVWGDGTYIYIGDDTGGVRAFTFDGATLTLRGSFNTPGNARGVWGDGNYIYVADAGNIRAYTFNGATFTATGNLATTSSQDVWGDGTYIYVADGAPGVRGLTFNGTSFTQVGLFNSPGTANDVWGDGKHIFVGDSASGIETLTFDGTTFTQTDLFNTPGNALAVYGDGSYIYAADVTGGLRAYSGFGCTACNTLPASCPTSGLAALWKMDEGTGTTTADSSGNAHTGTLTNMTPASDWVAGKVGAALDFDNVNDYVLIPDHASLNINFANDHSWSFWINARDLNEEYNTIFTSGSSGASYFTIVAHTKTNDVNWNVTKGIVAAAASGGGFESSVTTDNALTENTWYNVVVTFQASAPAGDRFKVYINGVDKTSATGGSLSGGGATSTIDPANTAINDFTGENFDGLIDDARIYNRLLTSLEIGQIYNGGSGCTAGVDTTPNAFSFTDTTGASTSVLTPSNIIQISGINAPTATSVSGGSAQYRICSDATCSTNPAWTTGGGIIANNQYLQLRLTSSASFSTAVSTTITVGSATDNWSATTSGGTNCTVTTGTVWSSSGIDCVVPSDLTIAHLGTQIATDSTPGPTGTDGTGSATYGCTSGTPSFNSGTCTAPDTTPNAFSFTDVIGATASTLRTSNIIQISGINATSATSISGGSAEYRVCADATCSTNPAWGTAASTIANNQYLQLRLTSSVTPGAMVSTTMSVGGVNSTWSVTTLTGSCGYGTWTVSGPALNFHSIASSADGTKLVAGDYSGKLYTTTDSGATWTARDSNRLWAETASSYDGTKLAAVVESGQIYTSTDSGVTWTARESARNWTSIASSSDGAKLAATVDGGQIYTSTDSGATWTARESNRTWLSIASSADGTKLAAAAANTDKIYTSTDSGATWTARASFQNWWSIASSADGTKLVAVADGTQIYVSTNSGVAWTARDSARQWEDVTMSADGSVMAAVEEGSGGYIYISTDTGVTWTQYGPNKTWRDITSSIDGAKLAAVEGGTGKIYTNCGPDGIPDAYSFTDVTGAALSTLTPSNIVQITGIAIATPTSISGSSAEYRICPDATCSTNPAWRTTASTINNNEYLQLRLTSSASYNTARSTTMTVGGVTDNWSVTTLAAASCTVTTGTVWSSGANNCVVPSDLIIAHSGTQVATDSTGGPGATDGTGTATYGCNNGTPSFNSGTCTSPATPNAFSFIDIYGAAASTLTPSNIVQITGISIASPTSISGGGAEYRICADATCSTNPAWGTAASTINNNQYLQLRLTSSATPGATVSTTMTVGGVSDIWNVMTLTGSCGYGTWTPHGAMLGDSVASSADGQKLIAVGAQLYTSTDSGLTWTARTSSQSWVASSGDGTTLAGAVFNGNIYVSTDSGVTWTARESNRIWSDIAVSADGSIMAATAFGASIYVSTDSGVTWTAHGPFSSQHIAMSADGSKMVAVAGGGFSIYTSTDRGVTWTLRDSSKSWGPVASSYDGTKLAAISASGSDQIYISTDSGVTWTGHGPSFSYKSVASSADGSILAAVEGGGNIVISTDSGATWTQRPSGDNWSQIAMSADGAKMAASSINAHAIYTNCATPPDTTPNAFSFTDVTGAAVSTLTQSNIIQISGITGPAATSISGSAAEYRVCSNATCSTNPAWGTGASTINNNQYLQLRLTSSASNSTAVSTTMTVGGVTNNWSVTTGAAPASCTVTTGTVWSSAGINCVVPSALTITHLGTQTATDSTDGPTATDGTGMATYGCNNGIPSFNSGTCVAPDATPNAFSFIDISGAATSALTPSNIVQISGLAITTPTSISGGGAEYRICSDVTCSTNPAWGTAASTITNNQYVQLRLTSSATPSTATTTTMTIGGVSDNWTVTTGTDSCEFATMNQIKLVASDGTANEFFGSNINFSPDGTRVLIASDRNTSNAGAAYMFNALSGAEIRKYMADDGAPDDHFGFKATFNPDATKLLISAPGTNTWTGSVYLINALSGAQIRKFTAPDGVIWDAFGTDIAFSPDGTKILVSAESDDSYQGSAYLLDVATGAQIYKITASDGAANDKFGHAVAFSPDGSKMLITAAGDDSSQGSAYLFDTVTGTQIRKFTASDGAANDLLGYSISFSPDGLTILIGAKGDDTQRGAVYLFNASTGVQIHKYTASDVADWAGFGQSVSFSPDGATLVIGADSDGWHGSVYLINAVTGTEIRKIYANDQEAGDWFGVTAMYSPDGGTLLVGSTGDASQRGAAYLINDTGCPLPPPSNCLVLGNTPWNVAGKNCSAPATDILIPHLGNVTANDTTGPDTGSITYSCNNGVVTPSGATCATTALGCSVAAGTTWTASGNSCTVPTTLNIAHLGSQLATDATAPTTGTVTYTCNNGVASTSGAVCNNMLPFDFTDVAGATAGVQYSDSATVSGVTGTQTATVIGTTDVQISKDNVTWSTSYSYTSGDTIYIRMNASASSGTNKVAIVVVGGQAVNWVVTTACGQ